MSQSNKNYGMCPICQGDGAIIDGGFHTDIYTVECKVCGIYKMDGDFIIIFRQQGSFLLEDKYKKYKDKIYILSGVTRNAFERGNPIEITHKNIAYHIDSAPVPATPRELLNRVLVYLAERAGEFGSEVQIVLYNDYPLFYAKSYEDLKYVISSEDSPQYLRHKDKKYRLTPEGWERAHLLLKTNLYLKRAFIAMWFDKDMKEAYCKAIKPAVKKTGYEAYRVDDDLSNTDMIVNKILAEIRRSRFIIIDLTGIRRSVIFEAGFALGLNIPVIWTCSQEYKVKMKEKNRTFPFDISHFPILFWKTHEELETLLIDKIRAIGLDLGPMNK